jgi:GNAT superfamily N-acetyltransferase
MQIRPATRNDVHVCFAIRLAVRENVLSDPTRITYGDYLREIEVTGRGWVALLDGTVRGFAVGRRIDGNIWALFVEPGFEGRGIGRALHDVMVGWLFEQGNARLWLTTGAGTRAERLYQRAGWYDTLERDHGDVRYELTEATWKR